MEVTPKFRGKAKAGMAKGAISRKGQVTLPKEIREALGPKPGRQVRFELKGGYAVLLPEPKSRAGSPGLVHAADARARVFPGCSGFLVLSTPACQSAAGRTGVLANVVALCLFRKLFVPITG